MDAATILSTARELTNTSSAMSNLNDTSLVIYLNEARNDVISSIVSQVGEDLFFAEFTADVVADQYKYQWEQGNSTTVGFKNLKEIGIKWDTTQELYTQLNFKESENVAGGDDTQLANTPQSSGFVDVQGEYIYVFPKPDTDVTDGLKVKVSINPPDLTAASTEAEIFPGQGELRPYHMLIALGMRQYIYMIKHDNKNAALAREEYKMAVDKMVNELKMKAVKQPRWRRNYTPIELYYAQG